MYSVSGTTSGTVLQAIDISQDPKTLILLEANANILVRINNHFYDQRQQAIIIGDYKLWQYQDHN